MKAGKQLKRILIFFLHIYFYTSQKTSTQVGVFCCPLADGAIRSYMVGDVGMHLVSVGRFGIQNLPECTTWLFYVHCGMNWYILVKLSVAHIKYRQGENSIFFSQYLYFCC